MNLWLSFNKAVTLWADRVAIIDGERRFTYRQFERRVANLAARFRELGISKGDRLAILAPNCHEYMEIYYATAVTGIVLVPVNYRLSPDEIVNILSHCGARGLFAHRDFFDLAVELKAKLAGLERLVIIRHQAESDSKSSFLAYDPLVERDTGSWPDLPQVSADDLAQIYYTSGTTGSPKGVMLNHGNVTFNALAVIAELSFNDQDTWLHAAPLFHLADAWAIFALTWVGGQHVFIPYFKPDEALAAFQNERVTMTVLVPTMLNALLHSESVKQFDYSSLRAIMTGGSPIAPEAVKQTVTTFGCEYIQLYGMTETSPFLTLSLPKGDNCELSASAKLDIRSRTGRPYIGAEVKVVRSDGSEVSWDNTEVGEIIARGPTITPGYWKDPETTAQTIKDGWIYTGDLAVVDSQGYINIVDRKKDMIITGGENVYSTEVEHVLHEHPAVAECAVFGIPDNEWGEAIKAAVVLKNGSRPDEQELIDFVHSRLAHYKAPASIDILKELPKTGSGKIAKKQLRERYWQGQRRQVH